MKYIPITNNNLLHNSRRDSEKKTLLTQDMESMTFQNTDTTQSTLVNQSFFGVASRNVGGEFFSKRRNVCKTAGLPKPHPSTGDNWKHGAYYSSFRQLLV